MRLNPEAKLVVNISYGAIAGQKDGGKFIEAQIKREIEMAECWGLTVHVVYAFGNNRNTRQVAEVAVNAGQESKPIVWTIHPDNPVPAILEMRVRESTGNEDRLTGDPSNVEVTLVAPDTTSSSVQPASGEAYPILAPDTDPRVWRVYHVPLRNFGDRRPDNPACFQIALAPTRRISSQIPRAEAGDWQVIFKNKGRADVDLVLQIQRGDTAPWLPPGGRQSHFAGSFVNVGVGGYPDLDVVTPLTNAGTQSSYTTAVHRRILTAGACERIFGDRRPASYSSKGAEWSNVQAPSDTRVVDRMFTKGLLTTGTYSGSTSRLSGQRYTCIVDGDTTWLEGEKKGRDLSRD